ncbi:MAG: hypothetical protein GF355_02990 [Candidatus Eisenbacteria bacterium]|nr:hypothetical protein [Candidatus Eisenbacteria bacterium]
MIQTPGRPPAVTLDDDWSLLQGDPGLFRDRLVLGGVPSAWRRLELYRGQRLLTRLERTPEGWARPSAAPLLGGPGPQERFTAAVENLAHLRFAEFGAAPSRPPDLRLRLEGSGQTDSLRIWRGEVAAWARGSRQPRVTGTIPESDANFWLALADRLSTAGY